MPKRRKNSVEITAEGGSVQSSRLSFSEAKGLFLGDIRLLSPETQRWHRENLTAVEKALVRQEVDVSDVHSLTAPIMKEHVVFYMFEEMGLKPNTINGRIRSLRALLKFLHSNGYFDKDFGADIPFIKGEKVIIEAFSKEQIEALLRQPDRRKFTGLRDYTLMLLLLETGIRIAECIRIDLEDVRMKEGQILIHGQGAKQRLVPSRGKFRRALQKYLEVRGAAE
jgi:integrase/recombinase XerD